MARRTLPSSKDDNRSTRRRSNGGYHKNQVICPRILYDFLHSWPSIHKIVCKYSHVDQSYSNFEFSVVAILIFLMEAITRIGWYVLNFEFSVAAILQIQNGGRHSSQITCLYFLCDYNYKKLSMHQISCFYDHLNNLATNRSTNGLSIEVGITP